MSLRRRITIVATAAVAVAVIVGSTVTYLFVGHELRSQIDDTLRGFGRQIQRSPPRLLARAPGARRDRRARLGPDRLRGRFRPPVGLPGSASPVFAIVTASGAGPPGADAGAVLPRDPRAVRLAASGGRPYFAEVHVHGDDLRVYTVAAGAGRAVRIGRSLNEVDHVLSRLRLILAAIVAGGIALAALLGRLVTGTALAPVRRLTETAEHVAQTQDLARRIATGASPDELGRLALSFNAMLDALERSMKALDSSAKAQRQLVADASHELRTPVTSVRANIEILQQTDSLPAPERERLLADVVAQLEELTALINDLIELARGDEPSGQTQDVRLDEVVADAIGRARRHTPDTRIEARLAPTLVEGVPSRLDRAVNNLIDNAIKFSPPGSPIDVVLRAGELTVRDHGPGIEPADMPHVFDRFYRGSRARALPGSGLGLAIVRQVANAHGGSVSAQLAAGGGTLMRLALPTVALPPDAAASVTAPALD